MDYQIDIDGYIGDYGYTQNYVKDQLRRFKTQHVDMRMSSYGGEMRHGLGIYDAVSDHGDVTVDLFGFVASTATWSNLKAKRIRIAANAFYLIHKCTNVVDVWESMNADQLAALIQELIQNKDENDKVDQVIAQMYAAKTGKSIQDILDLMKIGGWMNAKEALEWGFVDEIIPNIGKINFAGMKSKFNALGLPTNRYNKEDLFTIITPKEMKKQPAKINAILKVDKLEHDDQGVYLNEEQIESIETRLDTLENEVTTERTAKENAESRATTAEAANTAKDTEIANLKTQVDNLKKGAGDGTTSINKDGDNLDGGNNSDKDLSNTVKSAREMFNALPE